MAVSSLNPNVPVAPQTHPILPPNPTFQFVNPDDRLTAPALQFLQQIYASVVGINSGQSISLLFDRAFGSEEGTIIYRDEDFWAGLEPGSDGYVLTTHGPANSPSWDPASEITSIIAGIGLEGGGSSGDITISLTVPVAIVYGGTGATTAIDALNNLGGAPLNSPLFIGDPRAPTPAVGDNDTSIATTSFVHDAVLAAMPGVTHSVRVRTVSTTLNSAVANGGILQFDTIDHDSDGFAATTATFDRITVPAGLGGLYMLVGWSSGSGTQSTTLGMGVLINGAQAFSVTNQSISGPAAVNYVLDNGAVEIGFLTEGDILQLINNSVSAGTNAFTSVILTLARLEPSGPAGEPGTGASPSNTPPLMNGIAAPGVAATFSRGDHVHPTDAFLQDQIDDIAAGGGVGTITGVAAGTGLTGGGTAGGVTLSLITPVAVAHGGTGATTAAAALVSLGAAGSPVDGGNF